MDLFEAEVALREIGLSIVGTSAKSRSTYYALYAADQEDNCPRLRLSNHAVVHAISDCSVCVGTSPDDDVQLGSENWLGRAVKLLVESHIAHESQTALEREERDYENPSSYGEIETEQRETWRKWACDRSLNWGKLV